MKYFLISGNVKVGVGMDKEKFCIILCMEDFNFVLIYEEVSIVV